MATAKQKPQDDFDSDDSDLSDDLDNLGAQKGIPANIMQVIKDREKKQAPTAIPLDVLEKINKEKEYAPYTFPHVKAKEQTLPVEAESKPFDPLNDPFPDLEPIGDQPGQEPYIPPPPPPPPPSHVSQPMRVPYKEPAPQPRMVPPKLPFIPPPMNAGPGALSVSMMTEDAAAARNTQEYKDFAKDFEREFGKERMNQKEVEMMVKRLEARHKKMKEFISELEQDNDMDMLLFKNKLIREASDIQNDLREANANIIVLMNDRGAMKDKFCLMQIKLKKLKSMAKNFQEDAANRDLALQKFQAYANDQKEETEKLRKDTDKLKKTADEKLQENIKLRRALEELKGENTQAVKISEESRAECEKWKQSVNKVAGQLKAKMEENDKLYQQGKLHAQELKDLKSYGQRNKDDAERMTVELERQKKMNEELVSENKNLWDQNRDLKSANFELNTNIEQLNRELEVMKPQFSENQQDLEKFRKVMDEANRRINELQEVNRKLSKEPLQLKEQYESRITGADDENKGLKEELKRTKQENERLKKEVTEILEDMRKKNEERRRRKDAKMKKMLEEAKGKQGGSRVQYGMKEMTREEIMRADAQFTESNTGGPYSGKYRQEAEKVDYLRGPATTTNKKASYAYNEADIGGTEGGALSGKQRSEGRLIKDDDDDLEKYFAIGKPAAAGSPMGSNLGAKYQGSAEEQFLATPPKTQPAKLTAEALGALEQKAYMPPPDPLQQYHYQNQYQHNTELRSSTEHYHPYGKTDKCPACLLKKKSPQATYKPEKKSPDEDQMSQGFHDLLGEAMKYEKTEATVGAFKPSSQKPVVTKNQLNEKELGALVNLLDQYHAGKNTASPQELKVPKKEETPAPPPIEVKPAETKPMEAKPEEEKSKAPISEAPQPISIVVQQVNVEELIITGLKGEFNLQVGAPTDKVKLTIKDGETYEMEPQYFNGKFMEALKGKTSEALKEKAGVQAEVTSYLKSSATEIGSLAKGN